MFCPQCKTEYRPGFTECADCRVPLVEQLPPDEPANVPDPDSRFVDVLETWDMTDIAQIKAALEAAGIEYFIQGEIMRFMRPFDQPSIVMVKENDAERAIGVLRDLKLSYYRMIFQKP